MHVRAWQTVLFLVAISFVLVFAEIPRETWATSAALSLASGVAALTLMGAAAVLGSRWAFVESLFGGLDRVYRVHKWLGVWALALASYHLVFKAGLREWETASIITLPPYYTRLVRQLSFVALMSIVLLALNRNIPYHLWRWWHKLSGVLFVIVVLHWLSFKSPLPLDSPVGVWLATLATLGIAAAGYKLLLYPFLANHARYRVVSVTASPSTLQLTMEPVQGALAFEPGQFAFVRMEEDGLREPHPFTIASGSDASGRVEFVIRSLGDYTQRLIANVAAGMQAEVYAPYGRFRRPMAATREVWIGGGVGISPFLAWLRDENARDFDRVILFYCFVPGRDFPSAAVVGELAERRGACLVPVAADGRDPELKRRIGEIVAGSGPEDVVVSFCGPRGLLQQVRELLQQYGVPERNLHYEFFEFR